MSRWSRWLRLPRFGGVRYLPSPDAGKGELVVLVHGLICRSSNMMILARRLQRAGFAVYVYDYRTTTKNIAGHGVDFKRFLERLAQENPGRQLHIVTHSMGGIITREALGHLAAGCQNDGEILTSDRIGRIVMLAPPNHGSDAARRVMRWLPMVGRMIRPLPELSSAPDAYIHRVPVPVGLDIGILAGRFDGKVRIDYTPLAGMRHHRVVNAEHLFIMDLPSTARQIVRYLRTGRFTE